MQIPSHTITEGNVNLIVFAKVILFFNIHPKLIKWCSFASKIVDDHFFCLWDLNLQKADGGFQNESHSAETWLNLIKSPLPINNKI